MIRVIIADDFDLMRHVMQQLLEHEPDIRVVAEANNFEVTLQACEKHDFDVIVLNDYLPPYNCDTAIKQLRAASVTVPILVTSMHAEVNLARRAMDGGASGFVLKTDFQDQLVAAVRALDAGETYLSPRIAQLLNGSNHQG